MASNSLTRQNRTSFNPDDTYTAYICYDRINLIEYSFWQEPKGQWVLRKIGINRRPYYYRYINLEPENAGLLERKDALNE